ncbi:MAG: dihydropteroate synthase [Candidatus Omnitrophota bacterium]|jgi:dihydropteroate synthase|nr:MAG: dihydropteroate synthase [Candidatus Omnitrophota bacterium]
MNEKKWLVRNFVLDWDTRPLVMGILNVTPDSFSDGGRYYESSQAIKQAYRLIEDGADLIDVGGESSRPGAEEVSLDEELRRVIPVVNEVAGIGKHIVSVDTVKYEVAARALEAGAAIINDISGLRRDRGIGELAASSGAGLILMHMRGTPRSMQSLVHYDDVVSEIRGALADQSRLAQELGVQREQIALDPGIGFGKTPQQNLLLIRCLEQLRVDELPILIGVSRKSFIGEVTHKKVDDRLFGTAGAVAAAILHGANIVRVHDVAEMRDVVAVAAAIDRQVGM